MSISRTLTLTARLEGVTQVLSSLETIKRAALQVQAVVSSLGFNGLVGNGKNTSFQGDMLGSRFLYPELNAAIKQMQAKVPEIKEAKKQVNEAFINNEGIRNILKNDPFAFKKNLFGEEGLKNYNEIIKKANSDYPDVDKQSRLNLQRATQFHGQEYQDQYEIDSLLNNIPGLVTRNINRNAIGVTGSDKLDNLLTDIRTKIPKTYQQAFDDVTEFATHQNTKLGDLQAKYVSATGAQERVLTKTLIKEYVARTVAFKEEADKQQAKIREIEDKASQYLKTAFGLHIAQMYLSPIVNALQDYLNQMLQVYADFDKEYARYAAMSATYKDTFSKTEFASMSVGQVYSIKDATVASEKFAASGVDIAQSQEALKAVLQTATSAQISYDEAAYGVVRTMQAMHMNIEQTVEITDAMANAANNSTAEMKDLVKWFEYAAGAAFSMGLNVQDLAAYLAILSSTGTPGAGAAFRQMLIQLQQPDIQEKFLAKYSFLNKSDFSNIDQFIGKMRNYVQTSKDQKTAELEVVEVLQGRANAQQALQNLLMAQPELWNQITSAVGKTGSTQELYDKITANTGDTITKIKNDLMILAVQFGEVLGIILPPVEKVLSIITSIVVALPLPIKIIIGLILIAAVAVGTFLVALLGLIGAMAVMIANTEFMILTTGQLDLSINQITLAFTNFYRQILVSSGALTALKANMASFTLTTQVANGSVLAFVKNMSGMTAVTLGFAGATIGFMAQTELMHKQMYSEARLISLLTSIWIAYATAKAAASLGLIGLPGLIAGLAVGSAYLVWSQAQISDYEQKEYATFQRNKMGLNKGTGMTKNYNLNIANASINSEGMPLDDFVSAMTDTGEEY